MAAEVPETEAIRDGTRKALLLCLGFLWISLIPISVLKETPAFWHVRNPIAHLIRIVILKAFYPVLVLVLIFSLLEALHFLWTRPEIVRAERREIFWIRSLTITFVVANICVVGWNNAANIMAGRNLHDHSLSRSP
ncbi:MAG: hypothetical protein JWN25_2258 [Verrucomicrobiales bacterium]|nr:hypothetical protein [Verrucomicrobiales bacterium]